MKPTRYTAAHSFPYLAEFLRTRVYRLLAKVIFLFYLYFCFIVPLIFVVI